ncbi:hypothetical protein CKA32_001428 [Geitlerinema sp. FC II]|nr:hypothetical protein CKA32_001428 [Geitlerinema sp. FC II]
MQRLSSVSIPQRDFGEFQASVSAVTAEEARFQSLKGILVNFKPAHDIRICPDAMKRFNPSKGFW